MELKKGYRQTEVGIIPSEWELKQLDSISNVIDSLHVTPQFSENGFAMVRVTDIKTGDLNLANTLKVEENVFLEFVRNYKPKKGDIVLSRVGSYGVSSFVETDEQFCMGQNTVVIEPKLNNRFLYHSLNATSIKLQIELESYGSGYKSLSLKNIKELQIPLPPTKSEQTAIATALSDADALISNLEKLIEKKRNIKQGAMQQLLKPKKGWVVKKLGDILKVKHGKSQNEVEDRNGRYPILGTGGLMGFTNHYLYDKPSVLIGRKGTIDKPQYMETPFWTVDTLFYTEVFDGYNPKYIFYIFNLIDWYSHNEASGVPSLNAKTIEKIEKSFPSLIEQTKITSILSDMDNEITSLEKKLSKTKMLKKGMMQELLTGKIRLV